MRSLFFLFIIKRARYIKAATTSVKTAITTIKVYLLKPRKLF